jgi:hypothetical protein
VGAGLRWDNTGLLVLGGLVVVGLRRGWRIARLGRTAARARNEGDQPLSVVLQALQDLGLRRHAMVIRFALVREVLERFHRPPAAPLATCGWVGCYGLVIVGSLALVAHVGTRRTDAAACDSSDSEALFTASVTCGVGAADRALEALQGFGPESQALLVECTLGSAEEADRLALELLPLATLGGPAVRPPWIPPGAADPATLAQQTWARRTVALALRAKERAADKVTPPRFGSAGPPPEAGREYFARRRDAENEALRALETDPTIDRETLAAMQTSGVQDRTRIIERMGLVLDATRAAEAPRHFAHARNGNAITIYASGAEPMLITSRLVDYLCQSGCSRLRLRLDEQPDGDD